MRHQRAERMAKWGLQISSLIDMTPYFFSSGHVNYSRSVIVHRMTYQSFPKEITDTFYRGKHCFHHCPGIANGSSTDYAIETNYMRFGKRSDGLLGKSQDKKLANEWALCKTRVVPLLQDLQSLQETRGNISLKHKEEGSARILRDKEDRERIKAALKNYIHPLDPYGHPNVPVNIVTGKVSHANINTYDAVRVGSELMTSFVKSLPTGYHNPLSGKVINMETKLQNTKSSSVVNTMKPDVMYQRAHGLACTRDIDLREIFSYELSTLPLSLFKENGEMRLNNKSEIRTKVASLVSARKDVPTFCGLFTGHLTVWYPIISTLYLNV